MVGKILKILYRVWIYDKCLIHPVDLINLELNIKDFTKAEKGIVKTLIY